MWTPPHALGKVVVAVIASALLAAGCSPRVELMELDDLDAARAPRLKEGDGRLSEKSSRAVLQSLAREAGASETLLRHLAVEETYTGSPLVTGNHVHLLRDGDEAYPSMEKAMREAAHHIQLEVYTFTDDEVGHRIADILRAKARSGVEVNLVYDSVGCMGTDPSFFDGLRAAGIRVVEFNPIAPGKGKGDWRVEHRDHRKLLIVDNRVAFTGGINISTEYSGTSSRGSGTSSSGTSSPGADAWRDTNVRIEGPVVAEFQKMFRQTWEKQHGPPLRWSEYFRPAAPAGDHIVRAIASSPDDGSSAIHTTLLSAIASAEQSIHVTQMVFVPDEELLEVVRNAARRGVDVQMILPGEGFWMTRYAGRSHYSKLMADGVRVFERNGPLLHAKTAVIDGVWSTVGSTNIDFRSLVKNDEVNAVILGEAFAGELEAMFQRDLAESVEITSEAWRKRGLAARVKEVAARVWERLL